MLAHTVLTNSSLRVKASVLTLFFKLSEPLFIVMKKLHFISFYFLILVFASCNSYKKNLDTNDIVVKAVKPVIVTEKTLNDTDDPAIWINPKDPSRSLVLGTDKGDTTGGIYVFNLEGKIDYSKSVLKLKRPNNIDIEYGFDFNGKKTDIAVFTERGRQMIRIFSLPDMKAIDGGGIKVFEGETEKDPMGISLLKNEKGIYAIVGRKSGPDGSFLWEYKLYTEGADLVKAKKVRAFGKFSGKKEIESIVVDDELGYVYYSDETVGVRQFYASPDSSNAELSLFATKGVKNDHEGLSIFPTSSSTGYILLSDQQANRFQIFSREAQGGKFEHKLLKVVRVAARDSDGSDVTAVPLNNTFRHGLFVVMSTDRTFHFYRWEDIAGKTLFVNSKVVKN